MSDDFPALRTAIGDHFAAVLKAPVAAGCEYMSLTHTQFALSGGGSAAAGAPAQDAWPDDGPIQPLSQANAINTVGGTEEDKESVRVQRDKLWAAATVAQAQPNPPLQQRVAVLHTADTVESLFWYMRWHAPHLATKVLYARYHTYDALLYVRAAAMPQNVTGHFSKISGVYGAVFGLKYDFVLLTDWDAYIPALSAVPLPALLAGYQRAGVFLQLERNLNAGVIAFKRQDNTKRILHEWWEWGLTTVYRDGPVEQPPGHKPLHDQAALKLLLLFHLRQLTGDPLFIKRRFTPKLGKRNEPAPHPSLTRYVAHVDAIKAQSDYGFVGLSNATKYDYQEVALHNCGGFWWGCIPENAAALVQHHGSTKTDRDMIRLPLLRALATWLATSVDRWPARRGDAVSSGA